MVKTCVITGFGINADVELVTAFKLAGSDARGIHIKELIKNPGLLQEFQIIGFPGGFSFGDHLGSGKVFSSLFKKLLKHELEKFCARGKLVIGICNGFQVLVKMGILPNLSGNWRQDVSLIHNDSGVFEDRWIKARVNQSSNCVWTRGLPDIDMPVRHGEGKFIIADTEIEEKILKDNLNVLSYAPRHTDDCSYPDNPNGSVHNIAGITDPTGRIFGLMPHPEAFLYRENHPLWNRKKEDRPTGLLLFKNAVNYIKDNF